MVLGALESNPELARLVEAHKLPVSELGEEDFLLRTLVDASTPHLVIAGGGPRGVLRQAPPPTPAR